MKYEIKEILNVISKSDYNKGLSYPKYYLEYTEHYKELLTNIHLFEVESERNYDSYEVEIREKKQKIIHTHCTCPQYRISGSCKHIAACLIEYKDYIFSVDHETRKVQISKSILEEFYVPTTQEIKLKKQLNISVELEFINRGYDTTVYINLKIGNEHLYNLNNKLNKFLDIYNEKEGTLEFGKKLTYNPKEYFFSKTDETIINYFASLRKNNPYYNFQYFSIKSTQLGTILDRLENKIFTIKNYGQINKISRSNPLKMELSKKEKQYTLKLNQQNTNFLDNELEYVVIEDTLYIVPDKIKKIVYAMLDNDLDEIIFDEKDLNLFSNGILPIIKNSVVLDTSVENEIVIGTKPDIKIYLDLKDGIILCTIKLQYSNIEIDYFDMNSTIIREEETEKEVIEDLLSYGFIIENKKIYIDDLDTIGIFLEESLIELAKKYEVFTSDKMKNTKIIKNNKIQSTFSIGQDNIMKYEFDLGNIKSDEIVNILETLKNKKKYYRLKSGDLIDLEHNEQLQQLENLVEDMDITKKDLKNGIGIIPKYRAIYLDSIKKEKYDIIKTDNLFDELINNFNEYKNIEINFSKKDKKILRDYQEIGVKWLYNIYKCGFGGILADEMGLGKSIQLIYLIKQILKDKSDSKILIIAPTSLIYNWKNEFDKFGKELKYKVFAENKKIRKEELEHLDDINVLITTYGLVRQDREKYLNMTFELVAIDEAQTIKNQNAQMTKIVKELKAGTKLALTGTPLENSVLELWSIFDFIMPGYLANNLSFQKKYNIKDVDKDSLKSLDNLNKQIKPFILRRKKKDVVKELPDKIDNNIYIELNQEQKKLYVAQLEKTKKEMDDIIANEGFTKGNFKILQLLTKLRQLCIDPKIIYENYTGGSSKIENLVSLVKEIIANEHKILIFTSYKTALNIVNSEFNNHNISTYVIDGSVSSKKRMELVDKFNNDDTNVFLITLKAGGTGLNLTSADVVIHLDLWWNPQVENQATDRALRIGQKNTVEVIKLICKGTIEERILELQEKKKILSDKLIEGEERDQNIISKLTEKDIKHLLSLDNEEDA